MQSVLPDYFNIIRNNAVCVARLFQQNIPSTIRVKGKRSCHGGNGGTVGIASILPPLVPAGWGRSLPGVGKSKVKRRRGKASLW